MSVTRRGTPRSSQATPRHAGHRPVRWPTHIAKSTTTTRCSRRAAQTACPRSKSMLITSRSLGFIDIGRCRCGTSDSRPENSSPLSPVCDARTRSRPPHRFSEITFHWVRAPYPLLVASVRLAHCLLTDKIGHVTRCTMCKTLCRFLFLWRETSLDDSTRVRCTVMYILLTKNVHRLPGHAHQTQKGSDILEKKVTATTLELGLKASSISGFLLSIILGQSFMCRFPGPAMSQLLVVCCNCSCQRS